MTHAVLSFVFDTVILAINVVFDMLKQCRPCNGFKGLCPNMMVVYNELVLLGKIRTAHRRLQDDLFKIEYGET